MNLLKYFLLLLVFLSFLNASDEKLKIGVLYEKIFSSKKEAEVGIKLWLNQSHLEEYTSEMDVILYDNEKKFLEDFKKATNNFHENYFQTYPHMKEYIKT